MNHTPGLFGATVRGARSGLPWLSMLAISASVANAITAAAAGAPSAGDAQTSVLAAEAPAHAFITAGAGGSITSTAAGDGAGIGEACDATSGRMLYVGLNSWVPAETAGGHCLDGIP